MIHFAIGLFALSLTFAALAILSFASPEIADATVIEWTGAIAAVVASSALLYFVRRWRI